MTPQTDQIPVLLLGFNRPDKLRRAMEPLRQVRPALVFAAIDGPRPSHPNDAVGCRQTREVIDAEIDWPCEVRRLYRDENLGCRRAVSEAIGWALDQVEWLIVVEDDCVLAPGFFKLCAELLPRHRDHESVCSISAANFQAGQRRGTGDYYASKYQHCWGWATWKRAWRHYEDDLGVLQSFLQGRDFPKIHPSKTERAYWHIAHEKCVAGKVDSWAYRWLFSCWRAGGVSLIPNVSMVDNIGFDAGATHTAGLTLDIGGTAVLESCRSPSALVPDREADEFTFNTVYCPDAGGARSEVYCWRIKQLEHEVKALKQNGEELKRQLQAVSGRRWYQWLWPFR